MLRDALLSISDSIINQYGTDVVVKTRTYGAYNADTGQVSVAETVETTKAVIDAYDQRFIDGSLIHVGDLQALVAAKNLSVALSPGDVLVFDGADWSIISVRPTYLQVGVVIYELQIRK